MYFPQLMNIASNDLVLEIGPGAYPFWRSDCLADIFDSESEVDLTQFGGAHLNTKGKPLFIIKNNRLPFKDQSFDYVICSHVLEHVPTAGIPQFLAEIMRVGKRAYIEFPRPLYDYIYNFDVHLNLLDIVNGKIICLEKNKTRLSSVTEFQKLAMGLRNQDRFSVDANFAPIVAVGAEFSGKIEFRIVESEAEFFSIISNHSYSITRPSIPWIIWNKIRYSRMKRSLIGEKSRDYFSNILDY